MVMIIKVKGFDDTLLKYVVMKVCMRVCKTVLRQVFFG